MPWITVVDRIYTTAAPIVPNMHARGTSRLGFSAALEFCAADSMPRNAQSVSVMLDPMPFASVKFCGFQAAAKVSLLNQHQPIIEIARPGIMTPQTVTEPILPVIPGPPKLATVVSHNSTITATHVAISVDVRQGRK